MARAAALAAVALSAAATPTAAKPHIIFHLADDLGWWNVGWGGNKEARTPHLDELATSGLQLKRLYAFKYCSPTRSSLMSGRLPYHVTQNNRNNDVANPGGADLRMTLMPEVLKKAGYRTAMSGKWHVGARSQANVPTSRGFDSHLGFLKGGEDHYNQHSGDGGLTFVDLFASGVPAYGQNGTFSAFIYAAEAIRVIQLHDQAKPLFLYLAWQAAHTPLEYPARFYQAEQNDDKSHSRSSMNALVAALDEGVANVTAVLKSNGMWANTLVVFQADNGGWITRTSLGGNNWPLRGGKVSDFEGGVRVRAFLNGGYFAASCAAQMTKTYDGLQHTTDWYATFARLAGVDLATQVADPSVPALDSIDVWDAVCTPGTTSPRTNIVLAYCNAEAACDEGVQTGLYQDAAYITQHPSNGTWKIVLGSQGGLGWTQGYSYPNASTVAPPKMGLMNCSAGCLFNLDADPNELENLKASQPQVFEDMKAALDKAGTTTYQTNYDGGATECNTSKASFEAHHGFLAPRCYKP